MGCADRAQTHDLFQFKSLTKLQKVPRRLSHDSTTFRKYLRQNFLTKLSKGVFERYYEQEDAPTEYEGFYWFRPEYNNKFINEFILPYYDTIIGQVRNVCSNFCIFLNCN